MTVRSRRVVQAAISIAGGILYTVPADRVLLVQPGGMSVVDQRALGALVPTTFVRIFTGANPLDSALWQVELSPGETGVAPGRYVFHEGDTIRASASAATANLLVAGSLLMGDAL